MEYFSDLYKNVIFYMRFFFEKLACRTKPYNQLYDNDLDDIESSNFNTMQR